MISPHGIYYCPHCSVGIFYARLTICRDNVWRCYNKASCRYEYDPILGSGGNMLYIHYQHVVIADTRLTKLVASANNYDANLSGKINWDKWSTLKNTIIQIPAGHRHFDSQTKIWTVPTASYDILRKLSDSLNLVGQWLEHPDLELFVAGLEGRESEFAKKQIPKAEDFFYNNSQPVGGNQMPIAQIEAKLEELFSAIETTINFTSLSSEEKLKLYKKAARRFHPDLNNGDASKMSELNMYWQQYKQMMGVN